MNTPHYIRQAQYKKGFIAPLLLVLIAILAIGGGVYVYSLQKNQENQPATGSVILPQATSTIPTTKQTTTTTQTSDSQTAGWKIYTNTKYGFEIKLDPSWQMRYHLNGTPTDRPDTADLIYTIDGYSISITETSSKERQARWDEAITSRKSVSIAGLSGEDIMSAIEDTTFRTVTVFRPINNNYYKFIFQTYG